MRNFFVCLLFVSTIGYSQSNDFNLSEYKAFKTTIGNLSNQEQAVIIENTMEKILMSEFSWVDFSTGTGYFIIKNNNYIAAIESIINSLNNYNCSNSQELTLNENLFLEIYSKKSGIKNEDIKNIPPNFIDISGNGKKSELLYRLAKEIWVKKYPESYNALYSNKTVQEIKEIKEVNNIELPSDFPKFINSGNQQSDNFIYQKTKDDWILKNPEKYKILINFGKQNDSENQEKISKEQKINNHEN